MLQRPAVSERDALLGDSAGGCALPNDAGGPPSWAVATGLAILIGLIYGPAVNTPFIFDDVNAIVQNDSITSLWPMIGWVRPGPLNPPFELPTTARPLVNASFAVNYYFGGLDPTGYHVVNLVLHFFTAMLLWGITKRTLRLPYFHGEFEQSAGWLALGVAMLWALHPLQTEAVIYATQRTVLLMAFFYLATLYCSLRYWAASGQLATTGDREEPAVPPHRQSRSRAIWLMLAVIACLAGMASKEVMVSAPLIVLLFERTFISGSLASSLRRSWPLYIGLTSTWLLLLSLNINAPHSDAAGFNVGVPAFAWWLTQSKVIWMYLKLVVWPWPLLIHYQFPYFTSISQAWPYVVPLFLWGAATLVLLWRNLPSAFLSTWLFAILSPTLVIPIVTEMAAERRMYLALVAPVVIIVVGGYRLVTALARQRAEDPNSAANYCTPLVMIGVPTILITVAFCLISAKRLAAYDNELNLWLEVLQAHPNDAMAHQSIGAYLERTGDDAAAAEQYREVIRLDPHSVYAHYSLGLLLKKHGAYDEAVMHIAEAARILPRSASIRNNLGVTLYVAGHNDQAIEVFQSTIKMEPTYSTAYRNLGKALQKAGRYQESIEPFETTLRLDPKAIAVYGDLASSFIHLNQHPQAIAMFKKGLELARAVGDEENAKRFTAGLEGQSSKSALKE